jgi:hypothetical protein
VGFARAAMHWLDSLGDRINERENIDDFSWGLYSVLGNISISIFYLLEC